MVGRFIAMLALDEPTLVGLDDLVATLKARVPQLENEIVGRAYSGDKASASEAYIVSISGNHFAVAYVAQPAPAGTFDAAIGYARESWPDADDQIGRHKGHVIISNLIPTNAFDAAVDAAGSVTLLAGALNDLLPSLGVYWANGEVLQPADRFAALTDMLIGGQPPVDAWINIRVHIDAEPGAETITCASTLGLESFCGREIETNPIAAEGAPARGRALAVASDILCNGPELADNCEIRIGENDTVIVNLKTAGLVHRDQPIILLTAIEPESEPAAGPDGPDGEENEPALFASRRRAKDFAN